uniref:EamA domain-containing protein n=1 Tax=Alexandrium monilatum TaxID=311494 RepID=A0A7S4V549_9DINO|mmetsp:Transcript_16406/g.52495  ORF Transcript_16406/g.52495 Transcript_16406/m.52495 type:complete len:366 (+) Transcript_16406:56-1153(+)
MFIPSSFGASLATALFSMCCWGSWSNTLKATAGRMRFEVFYVDYSIFACLTSLAAALTLGMVSSGSDKATFLDDFREMAPDRYAFALAAGLVFNAANLCLCKGIGMLGLALAFPICIGTAMLLGTVVTYAVQPSGSFGLLMVGVLLGFSAVCLAALAQRMRDRQRGAAVSKSRGGGASSAEAGLVAAEGAPREAPAAGPPFARRLSVCLVGGVLMGLWNPLVTLAEKDGGLSSYTEMVFFTLAVFLSSLAFLPIFLTWPLEGGAGVPLSTAVREYCLQPPRAHALPALGGFIWALGSLANAVAGTSGVLNPAESYAIGQCANVIAIFWGVLYFREFSGAGPAINLLLALICCLYAGAIACVAAAG